MQKGGYKVLDGLLVDAPQHSSADAKSSGERAGVAADERAAAAAHDNAALDLEVGQGDPAVDIAPSPPLVVGAAAADDDDDGASECPSIINGDNEVSIEKMLKYYR